MKYLLSAFLCFFVWGMNATAYDSPAFTQATTTFRDAARHFDQEALRRSIALADAAKDAPTYSVLLLQAQAWYRIAQLSYYDEEQDVALEAVDTGLKLLTRATLEQGKDYQAHAWRLLLVVLWEEIKGAEYPEEENSNDLAYIKRHGNSTELANFAIAMRMLRDANTTPSLQQKALEIFQGLAQVNPGNPEYQAYRCYLQARVTPEQREKMINQMTSLLNDFPEQRVLRALRGRL
jgi:hypothetical protein